MATAGSQLGAKTLNGDERAPGGEFTVEQVAALVGMSPRNIRAHQARKLVPPPTRRGRVAYYDENHVRRLRMIVALQRQGFNLASIEAMLGARAADPRTAAMVRLLEHLAAEKPALLHALGRHNIVAFAGEGTVQLARPQAVGAALGLQRSGLAPARALQLLADALTELGPAAERLAEQYGARLLAELPSERDSGTSFDHVDQDTVALIQGITELLSAAFRVAVENRCESIVTALVGRRFGVDLSLDVDPAEPFDIG